jgi:myo-inositol 2-dehydrogenase/D-chiro-inositol 1-dehydrogenase
MNDSRRRLLLGGLGAVGAGAGISCTLSSSAKSNSTRANSAVTFGIIGVGLRGSYVGAFMADNPGARLTAMCDLYPGQIAAARRRRLTTMRSVVPTSENAKVFTDYRDLLASPDVDAVLIATPPYQHPEQFEAAVQSRKHIYCEKPVAVSVAGAKRVLAAGLAADPSKTVQFGFQQRLSPEYLKAYSILQSGKIGKLQQMISSWILPMVPDPPKIPRVPYQWEEEKIRKWVIYRETSGCPIVDQDCHGIDAMNWFAGAHPVKATGTGSVRLPIPGSTWTSDHHNITYFYPEGVEGYLRSIKQPLTSQYREVKEQFYGTEGVLETTRSSFAWHGQKSAAPMGEAGRASRMGQDVRDFSLLEAVTSKREITIDAVESFFRSIAESKPVNQTQAAVDSTLSALGRMAYETRREATWSELVDSDY